MVTEPGPLKLFMTDRASEFHLVIGDTDDEYPNETFVVGLSNAVLTAITDGLGRCAIVDNDDVYSVKVWTGTGNWTDHAGWTPYGQPSPSDDVHVESGILTLSNGHTVASPSITTTRLVADPVL